MRVLLVEDDAHLSNIVERALRSRGHAVDTMTTVAEATKAGISNEYNVIVLDRQLPDGDGVEVCRALRAQQQSVPILMLTVRDSLSDRVEGLDAGADDYLGKPFELEEFFARVRALGRRMPAVHEPVLSYDDLVVDTRANTATRGGRPLDLTRKEYMTLEILARNVGRVVSRAEITEYVWDDRHDPVSNALEVTVNRLRSKVDASGPPLVQTRRGAGYYLGRE
ncbi:MAG: response regulator transcription factor [Gemmatimonadetes bacterium]|nr:response regulator transcription factor [Gemmatimonadota bacterium]